MSRHENGVNHIGKEYYDQSGYYDAHVNEFSNLHSNFQKYRISKVLEIYTPKKEERVLDLGCGWGTFCFAVSPLCKEVVGLDFSQNSISLCNNLLEKGDYENVKFVCLDAQDTGLPSGNFDIIISADLFEHLYPETFENILDECKRLLKKGGRLVIWTPHRGHILEIMKNNNIFLKKDVSHVDYKSMSFLTNSLKKRGFQIKKQYYAESHIPVFRSIEKILLGVLPIFRRRIAILAQKM